jgi:hypothetical protein
MASAYPEIPDKPEMTWSCRRTLIQVMMGEWGCAIDGYESKNMQWVEHITEGEEIH